MSNISGLFEKKVTEVVDSKIRLHIRVLLNNLIVDSVMNRRGLSSADITNFCEMTPNGEALRDLFLEYRLAHKSENVDFVNFARHIIGKSLKTEF